MSKVTFQSDVTILSNMCSRLRYRRKLNYVQVILCDENEQKVDNIIKKINDIIQELKEIT